ncbi:HAD family hydrolase [Streptomyces sp. MST-110588]|uniref:HAD family hydrolase n=1 Tax=Streptomyces sp. MST-110588 TaxID=2833628 RepID=UPI001F5D8493|nr:HAD family hydrolase [Streptomyces sp. MST-110588]UNO38938.1 HAD-IA family hydrolase [Streptomyces sp. MST-110588]
MAVKGVLFDFSGTLLRIESAESWLRAALAETGTDMEEADVLRSAAELERAGALPGGSSPVRIPPELAGLWEIRDRTGDHHRELYTSLARQVPLPRAELYDVLYDRHKSPSAWSPYPDAAEVLDALWRRGVRIGVVSNIGWDLRPVLRAHGLDRFVGAYALSFEHGVQKPDPRLFGIACQELGTAPQDVVMVGDDRRADGGATALGCAFLPVDHLPVHERPDGLRPVLALAG